MMKSAQRSFVYNIGTRCTILHQIRRRRTGFVRWKSSASAFVDLLPESLQKSVKSTVLNEVARDDSRLWRSEQPNGANSHHHRNGAKSTNRDLGSVNDSTDVDGMPIFDPLDDLYNTNTTRYWPYLPPHVRDTDPFELAKTEVKNLANSIREDLIGTDHPVLNKAASYFFDSTTTDGGKKIRPMMVLLLSRALADSANYDNSTQHPYHQSSTNEYTSLLTQPLSWQRPDLPSAQRRLAEISEMIHTASLFHDDVIDGSDTRRGAPAVHMVFGNKMAILAGDYLLARASICLARLRHCQVIETMSTIIEHLVRGEVMQLRGGGTSDSGNDRILYYLRKNFYKTGSLMANSCKSAALLGDYPPALVNASYRFGKHVGMAFQLVDDVLDFEGSLSQLGKPALADLRAGLATAPVLFAVEECHELIPLMERKFQHEGDIDRAVAMVASTSGMERTKEMARVHAEIAMDAILELNPSEYRDALIQLANKVVARTK